LDNEFGFTWPGSGEARVGWFLRAVFANKRRDTSTLAIDAFTIEGTEVGARLITRIRGILCIRSVLHAVTVGFCSGSDSTADITSHTNIIEALCL